MGDTCRIWLFDAYLCPDHRFFSVNDDVIPDEKLIFLVLMQEYQWKIPLRVSFKNAYTQKELLPKHLDQMSDIITRM